MGTENNQVDDDVDNEFGFQDENLSPEEEAALRGETAEEVVPPVEEEVPITEEELEEIAENRSQVVPHSRFHEVNERLKVAEAELERMRKPKDEQQPATQNQDEPGSQDKSLREQIKELTKKQQDAMFEGDQETALEIADKIEDLREEIATNKALERMNQQTARAAAAAELTNAAEEVVTRLPYLADGDGQNPEAVDDFLAFREAFIAKGNAAPLAMLMAADKVAKIYGEPGELTPEEAEAKARAIKAARIAVNAKAAQQVPPKLRGGSGDRKSASDGAKRIAEMGDKEFDNMDPEEEKRLRG